MSGGGLERIKSIGDFTSLVEYLRDELDWPLDAGDVEDLAFDYQPDELGLDEACKVRIREIKQLRPVSTRQPWGIFFVEFEPKRLPVVVLRRILRALVPKKRAGASPSQRAVWNLNDLLFISALGEAGYRGISFAHFRDNGEGLPQLRTFSWDKRETHFYYLRSLNLERLRWPEDEDDANAWRDQWASAFTTTHRQVIRTSKELSLELARLACRTRELVHEIYEYEAQKGPLHRLHRSVQQVLIEDLELDGFADMVAQTIAYGLFSARAMGEPVLGLVNLEGLVPSTNPFLRELFAEFTKFSGVEKHQIDFDELGVAELVELLNGTDMESVLRDFGRQTGGGTEDPVVYFYELFLQEYDKKQKVRRGVFYTPKPVVSFIVRSVDALLRSELELEDGLADTTTWGEMVRRHPGLALPAGAAANTPVVQVLDPAVGTGTFLVEVIDTIYRTMTEKWRKQGRMPLEFGQLWNEYVPKHLLPRLYGFELMMAPYAIAHMKVGLKLVETGYLFESDERVRIYLTNTLEEPKDFSDQFESMAPALAHEARAASEVKAEVPLTVVIGNPPYSKISANLSDSAVKLIEPFRYIDGERIVERGALALELNLQDDYIKFFGFMVDKLQAVPLALGSFISNFRYLDSPSLRGMRKFLLDVSSSLTFVNLGGHVAERVSGAEPDENVFDIEQGVAISLIRKSPLTRHVEVEYCRLAGSRSQKYALLSRSNTGMLALAPVTPGGPLYKFTDARDAPEQEFHEWPSLDEVFPINSGSIITSRDNLAVSFDRGALLNNIRAFAESPPGDLAIQRRIGFSAKAKWDIEGCKRRLRNEGVAQHYVRPILYRPFDIRNIYYYPPLLDTPSRPVCRMLEGGTNVVLLTPRVKTTPDFCHILVSRFPAEKKVASHDRATQMFPLWMVRPGRELLQEREKREPNIAPAFHEHLLACLGTQRGGAFEVHPEDVLHYVYAILHSEGYRARYGSVLRDGYPRIPFVDSRSLFQSLCVCGADLVALHLMEGDYAAASWNSGPGANDPFRRSLTTLEGHGSNDVGTGAPTYDSTRVFINPSRWFKGVPQMVWEFRVGGYRVCEKWLKDRRGRVLSDEDIAHYQRIVVALNETIRLMCEIEDVIEAHGGWPPPGSVAGGPVL